MAKAQKITEPPSLEAVSKVIYKGFSVFQTEGGVFYVYFPVNLMVSNRTEFPTLLAAKVAITKFIKARRTT